MRGNMIFKRVLILIMAVVPGITTLAHAETSGNKTSIEDVKKETQDMMNTLGGYTVQQRDEAIQKTKVALKNLDNRIDTLENRIDRKWDTMSKSAREQAQTSLKSLREQRVKVAEWYGGLKNSSSDAWEHMKTGFLDAYRSINDAWSKAVSEYESGK